MSTVFWETPKAYRYDGSFAGFLSCVFESYQKKEIPAAILSEEAPASLFPQKWIDTDDIKARKVYKAIREKSSSEAREQVALGFLTFQPEKEMLLLRFIHLALEDGPAVVNRLADPVVNDVFRATRHLQNESHLLLGFIRFSDHNGILTSVIEPKNRVLPVIAPHFCDRFSGERFLIWDKNHKEAFIHSPEAWKILPMENFAPPPPDKEEQEYQALWKKFYETIAIEGRYNPKCRQTHMPKRYWNCMTEFQKSNYIYEEPFTLPSYKNSANNIARIPSKNSPVVSCD